MEPAGESRSISQAGETLVIDAYHRLTAALADRYRLERELGQGGMATVYLAEDLRHQRQVAIKVLRPELAAVLGAERFVQEIKTTAALQHPHVLPLFDSGQADGFLYYVMPYIEGETLRSKLNRDKQLGIDEAVRIATSVADALDYAHRHGVIHRDIKPENILLHDGRPMVADFGIALAVSAAAGGRMTETGLSLGTPHYMSPEQATADRDITARSDVYSLASVLYEMLAGEPPHMGNSAQQVIMKIVTDVARPVTELRKSVPPNVAAAVAKALEKLPADRFDSAKAFADALADRSFTSATLAAGGAAGWIHQSDRLRDPWFLALGGIAALASAGLVWSLASHAKTPVGPTAYDVGLPDSAPLLGRGGEQPFVVSPNSDFVVYVARERGGSALWYRSLRDASVRRIAGTDNGYRPALSPDGSRIAFARTDSSFRWTLEVVPVGGGATATLGDGQGPIDLKWLDDGRIQVVGGDGTHARWFDPGGGPTEARAIKYCILPSYLVSRDQFLCGGGGNNSAVLKPVHDTTLSPKLLRTSGRDSAPVFGSDFHLVDDRYLVYLSPGGDLLAAPVDLGKARVGRSVRLLTGIERTDYLAAGSFDISRSGTLVYAEGPNYAVGNLVTTDGQSWDTLQVGREAFHLFAMSPDGRRLAATVDVLEGHELRIYDLVSGAHTTVLKHPDIRQPVWSPGGDRLVFTIGDSVMLGDPDGSTAPEFLGIAPGVFETFSWLSEHQVFGGAWDSHLALSFDPTRRPIVFDTLVRDAAFPVASPDGRWLAYNDPPLAMIWLAPLPATGKRYQVASDGGWEPKWLSNRELVYGGNGITRATIDFAGSTPVVARRRWVKPPRMVETAGESFQVTPDGRILFVQTMETVHPRYLRVIPDWVRQMKRAVDEANR